ncbi:MAG: hypothetical protein JSR67_11520 [Proteobacteria bacterium]|nr:hypothetical protein [Pseudomonadota bacterium]
MSDPNSSDISRRQFLVTAAGATGAVMTGAAFAATPCAPGALSVAGGTSSSTSCVIKPGSLPAIALLSTAPSGSYAWTAGQAFRQGDVPGGSYLSASGSSLQADIRNRWPDGSVKFAVLSGVTAFRQNQTVLVQLAVTGSTPTGTVAEPASLPVTVTFSGAVTGSYALQSCVGVDRSTWNKAAGGRVRQIPGPVMSEFHYYCPTSDAHVALWFYVRCYSNGAIEVETVVENGWMNVPAPGERDYSVSVSVGGRVTYSGTLAHLSHSRWSRVDWLSGDPQLGVIRHDAAYLRASKLVPNYGYTPVSAAAFNGLATAINPVPFAQGNWRAYMPGTGDDATIGVLPNWEALYCTSADPRAWAATVSNNRGSGRWPIHYRDETTGRVPLYASYPAITLSSGAGPTLPAPTGTQISGGWDIPHHPSNGYLPYLLEGRWTALESLQFAAAVAILQSNPVTRQGGGVLACINAPLTTRGAAWSWRTMGQAAAISPEQVVGANPAAADLAVGDAFRKSIDDTASWNRARYVDGSIDSGAYRNSVGWLGQYGYDRYNFGTPDQFWGASFMVMFQIAALAHISDLGISGINQANLAAMRDHAYDGVIIRMGTDATWNYRRAGLYEAPYLKSYTGSGPPVFMGVNEAYQAYLAASHLSALSANDGDTLKDHDAETDMNGGSSSNDVSGFWAYTIANLATATEHGKAGAAAAYRKVTLASNYNPVAHGIGNLPKWGIVPRS